MPVMTNVPDVPLAFTISPEELHGAKVTLLTLGPKAIELLVVVAAVLLPLLHT